MSTTKKIISFTIVLILAFIENCLGELRVIGEPVQDGVEAKSFCSLNALSGTMDYIGLRTDASSCLIVDDTQVAKLVICDLLGKVSAEIVLETELAQPILVPVSNLGAIGRGGLEHESTDVALNNLASEGLGKASFTGSTLELGPAWIFPGRSLDTSPSHDFSVQRLLLLHHPRPLQLLEEAHEKDVPSAHTWVLVALLTASQSVPSAEQLA